MRRAINRFNFSMVLDGCLQAYGDDTLVNGQRTQANWQEAELSQVQQYLADSELRYPCFVITLQTKVLDPPFSINNGSELQHVHMGYKVDVRKVIPPGMLNASGYVRVIAVMLPRS